MQLKTVRVQCMNYGTHAKHDMCMACICSNVHASHSLWLSCMFTCTHKCDSSSKYGPIEHSIALHSVASGWGEVQQIALRIIHLCTCKKNNSSCEIIAETKLKNYQYAESPRPPGPQWRCGPYQLSFKYVHNMSFIVPCSTYI